MSETPRIAKNYLHIVWRIPVLIIWVASLFLIYFVMHFLRIDGYDKLPNVFHRGVCAILGINVIIEGALCEEKPTLYVCNHISYLDIFVLGYMPSYFVAKSEVANWPILGTFARFQNTIFIERNSRKAQQVLATLKQHLHNNESLTIFPEGTSTNGDHVKPFKSSLFEAVAVEEDQKSIPIQPITVAYLRQNGQKMDQTMRDYYAWYDTMPFLSHFRTLFLLKKVDVKIRYHQVCYLEQFDSRKACASFCQQQVESGLDAFLTE